MLRVLVTAGDTVEVEQPVLELETDKATIEVPSSVAGKVTDVKVKAGDKVKVGQVIFVVEGDAAGAAPVRRAADDTPAAATRAASARRDADDEHRAAGRDAGLRRRSGTTGDAEAANADGEVESPRPLSPWRRPSQRTRP